jgi:secreted PhoX family phosphatase
MKKAAMVFALVLALGLGLVGSALGGLDFGLDRDKSLASKSKTLFGIVKPIDASSTSSISAATANADPTALATVASGLTAKVATSGVAAPNIDMIALWPNDTNPQWLIACNEQGTADPGVQRIELATGAATTIVTGTSSCDGIRRTPWGTILFSEEVTDGRAYELIDPLHVQGVSLDRTTGVFSGGTGTCAGGTGACHFATRTAMGSLAFEGISIYANGLTYYGDENRPSNDNRGGAYFKFVPSTPGNPATYPITSLEQSPLTAGSVFGLQVGRRNGSDFGQGTSVGFGTWIGPISFAVTDNLRTQTPTLHLTGYYRPEDNDIDRVAEAAGQVRFCGPNTGNEFTGDSSVQPNGHTWGEVVCITDGTSISNATSGSSVPDVQYFVLGNPQFAMPDNVAYQPGRANWVVHEDGDGASLTPARNNDLWDCLPDGADDDLQSDGCVRIATLNDLTAEWTGGIFDATGTRFFVSVQHNVSGHGVVLEINGWK